MSQFARTPAQIGQLLRRARTMAGLTQRDVAERARLRQETVSRIELGHDATKLATLCALLAALDLELTVAHRSRASAQDIEDIF